MRRLKLFKKKKKVLVVRPSRFTSRMIKRLKEKKKEEYEFVFAEDPRGAKEIAGNFHPDLIVYDYNLEEGYGEALELFLDSIDLIV